LGFSQLFLRSRPDTGFMTSLRPLVIPAAAVVLAAGVPSANAHPRRPVYPSPRWAATPPRPTSPAAVRAGIPTRATPVRAAQALPHAVRTAPGEAAVPTGRHGSAAPPTDAAAATGPITASARGPPL
jgi:hypothetical protein